MKIVITGSLGHIGSRLIHDLPTFFPDAEVLLLDNLATQRYCSLFRLPDGVRFRFLETDVCQTEMVPLFAGADAVIHLAAMTDAASSFANPEQVEKVNYDGTERVARACAATGARMILLSTTSVYGTQEAVVDEGFPIADLKPQSPYAASKLRAEQLLQSLGQEQGLRFVTFRFGTIFGTSVGMRFHTAVNKFCWQACLGQPLTVWRTALNQKRPYLALTDGVRALMFAIQADCFDNQTYNVVTLNAAVSDIVETIRQFVPDVQVKYVDSPIMNQLSYNVSSAKFTARGFQFTGSLRQSVAETIALLRNTRSGAV